MNTKQSLQYAFITTLALIFIAISPASVQLMTESTYTGNWVGILNAGNVNLRIVLHVTGSKDSLSILLDSPDQNAYGIRTGNIYVTGDSLAFNVPSIGGRLESQLSPQHDSLIGVWKQGPARLPLIFAKAGSLPTVDPPRPQTPQPPFSYRSEDVVYHNLKDSITLAGTLTLPKGNGPFPAVILITGSGPQNRDEEIFRHKPFFVISDYLTRRGIAVLRVDDRGIGGSTGRNWDATTSDFAGDVLCGVDYLKTRTEINSAKIGLIGHSEGGMIAPLAASRSNDVCFIVMMAGTGVTGEEIVLMQDELMSRANGTPEYEIRKATDINKIVFRNFKRGLSNSETVDAVKADIALYFSQQPDSIQQKKAETIAIVESEMKPMLTPWFRYFLTYDPRPALRKVRCPVLAMNGSKDLQVPPEMNLTEIEKALKSGGNNRYVIKTFEGLNHLFQHAKTGSPMEYARIEETIAPEVLRFMGDWIEKTLK